MTTVADYYVLTLTRPRRCECTWRHVQGLYFTLVRFSTPLNWGMIPNRDIIPQYRHQKRLQKAMKTYVWAAAVVKHYWRKLVHIIFGSVLSTCKIYGRHSTLPSRVFAADTPKGTHPNVHFTQNEAQYERKQLTNSFYWLYVCARHQSFGSSRESDAKPPRKAVRAGLFRGGR